MDDLEFVYRCTKGDKQSWQQFIERYSRLIYSAIHAVLKIQGVVFQSENTSDIFQEVFLSLAGDNFKKLKSFKARNRCSLATWLRQVVVNIAIDYLRKTKPAVSLDEEDDQGKGLKDILAASSIPADTVVEAKERVSGLKDCIKGLEREDKYFLELYLNRSLGLEEISRHLRVSRGAVDMRKNRILERLKDCFRLKGFALDF